MKYQAPYQIFFVLGILAAFLGVGVWFLQGLDVPILWVHSRTMFGGFLWSFITGFLMTAVPRMSGTEAAGRTEIAAALALVGAMLAGAWAIEPIWFYGANALLVCFLILFGARRVLRSRKPIPVFFSHIGMAMALTLAGCYFQITGQSLMGLHIYHVGPILLLVLGIGTRFFSFLSGLESDFENAAKGRLPFHLAAFALVIALLFAGAGFRHAYLALTLISLFYLVSVWSVFRRATRPSPLKTAVRLVSAMIPLSFLLCWIEPAYLVAWLHLLFIGTFGLITFSVATRVTLAHGSYSTDWEMKSPMLWVLVLCLAVSAAARIAYGTSSGTVRDISLHLAACAWIAGLAAWSYSFLIRILKPGELEKPTC
jgi:uncharacterized protein involved in response to NO